MTIEMSRMTEYNTWWDTGEVREQLCPSYERRTLADIIRTLQESGVTAVRGLRRTGKSTLLYQAIRHLLENGTDPVNVLYFTFDDLSGNVQDLLDLYRDRILREPFQARERIFIFLDEVQKCPGWAEQVKRNYDLYPSLKFVVTGSASLEVGAGATESLAGRWTGLILPPMSFDEYLGLLKVEHPPRDAPLADFIKAAPRPRPLFEHYLMTGGLPEVAGEKDHVRVREYVISGLVQRVVHTDLFPGGSVDTETAMTLLRAICEKPGLLLNYERLSSDTGRNRRTISSYISKLEDGMVIRTLGNLRGSSLSTSRKNRKAYPASTAMTYAFLGARPDGTDLGRVVETAVLTELNARYFWRERNAEVDLLAGERGEVAVEVKLGGKGKLHFGKLIRRREIERAVLVTWDESGEGRSGGVEYIKVPAWVACAGGLGSVE